MKIILLAPHTHPIVRGNAVTVSRIAGSLIRNGCSVRTLSADLESPLSVAAQIEEGQPDLLHAFHAHDAGSLALAASAETGTPYIVTLTGSDIYEALIDSRREQTIAALRAATFVTAFHELVAAKVVEHVPELRGMIRIVPQGVCLPTPVVPAHVNPVPVLFLPAGLRPVKSVLHAIRALGPLFDVGMRFRLVIAGPAIHAEYAAAVVDEVGKREYARYVGVVDHARMDALFGTADIVLNTSAFEGGMANSILEGMAAGKPIVASDIEGNRSIVIDGITGLLYRTDEELRTKVGSLLADLSLRTRFGEAGRRLVQEQFSLQREADLYLDLYREALDMRGYGRKKPQRL